MNKTIFTPGNYPKNRDIAFLIPQIAIAGFMLTLIMGRFLKLFGDDPIKFADSKGVGVIISITLVVLQNY